MARVRAVMKIDDGILRQAERIAPRAMRKALNKGADHALKRIKGAGPQPAPIRTGALRRSYEKRVSHRGLRILVRSNPQIASYAGFVEFGTLFMTAREHFRPAIKAAKKIVRREATRILTQEFKRL